MFKCQGSSGTLLDSFAALSPLLWISVRWGHSFQADLRLLHVLLLYLTLSLDLACLLPSFSGLTVYHACVTSLNNYTKSLCASFKYSTCQPSSAATHQSQIFCQKAIQSSGNQAPLLCQVKCHSRQIYSPPIPFGQPLANLQSKLRQWRLQY